MRRLWRVFGTSFLMRRADIKKKQKNFLWLSLGSNQYRAGGFMICVCILEAVYEAVYCFEVYFMPGAC